MPTKKAKTRSPKELNHLKLGEATTVYKDQYDKNLLQSFINKNPESSTWVSFLCSEFTSLCPQTGQPDFGRMTLNYIPATNMVESKALKLYLFSFRNHGAFHEDCVAQIGKDLVALLKPKYLEVVGEFHPRGGIAIFPYFNYSSPKKEYQSLKDERTKNFVPGKYSMPFQRIY